MSRQGATNGLADNQGSESNPQPAARSPQPSPWPELLLALGVVLLGALVLWETREIRVAPTYARVGPRVIPYIVGGGLVALGLWLIVDVLRGHLAAPTSESEDADPTRPTDWSTVGLLTGALVVYVLLIERAGFIIASTLLFLGAAFAMGSRRVARDLAIGILLSAVVFFVFTRGLNLRLPDGVFSL